MRAAQSHGGLPTQTTEEPNKFKQNDNNLAIAYYRFSSHSQNEASTDRQREQAQVFVKAHGYNIVKEYEDAAMSGTTSERPQYQLMLSEVGTIRPAAVILWKTDRLGRDRYELTDAKRRIRDAGCRICLSAEPTPDDSPESVLMETMMEGMAEFYSRQLSVNIRRGMNYNVQHALYNGHKVWGYGVDDEKRYVVDEATPRSCGRCSRATPTAKRCSPSATTSTRRGFGRRAGRCSASRS